VRSNRLLSSDFGKDSCDVLSLTKQPDNINDGTRPLSQVADLLGFSALSAFSRWYKQQFGEVAARPRRAGPGSKPLV